MGSFAGFLTAFFVSIQLTWSTQFQYPQELGCYQQQATRMKSCHDNTAAGSLENQLALFIASQDVAQFEDVILKLAKSAPCMYGILSSCSLDAGPIHEYLTKLGCKNPHYPQSLKEALCKLTLDDTTKFLAGMKCIQSGGDHSSKWNACAQKLAENAKQKLQQNPTASEEQKMAMVRNEIFCSTNSHCFYGGDIILEQCGSSKMCQYFEAPRELGNFHTCLTTKPPGC